MSAVKYTLPLLMLVTCFSGQAPAQTSSLYKTTYRVQVQYEMWRNGYTYWDTEFETTNYFDAITMLSLFQSALDNGTLSDIMNCGPDWIAVDVRLTTKKEYYRIKEPLWIQSATRYR